MSDDNVVSFLPPNVVDLDAYRKRRIAERTWPPEPATLVEYWRSVRDRRKSLK